MRLARAGLGIAVTIAIAFLCSCSTPGQSTAPSPPQKATYIAGPFEMRAGGADHAWLGDGLSGVLNDRWRRRNVLAASAVEATSCLSGEYWVRDGRMTVVANLGKRIRITKTYQWEGDVSRVEKVMPFLDRIADEVERDLSRGR